MLIEIDETVLIALENTGIKNKISESLGLLAQSAREGHHFVYANMMVLDRLAESSEISLASKATYSALINRMSFLNKVKSSVTDYIICYYDVNRADCYQLGNAIWIPIEWFDSSSKIQPTMLVAENDSDCELYAILGKLYSIVNNLPNDIRFIDMPGGGNTIGKIYNKRQNNFSTPVICIADSDKSCPVVGYGETAKTVISSNDPDNFMSTYEVLTVRMLENLLPLKFYSDVYGKGNGTKAVVFLDEISKSEEFSEIRRYINFKKGICYKKVYECKKDAKKRYWKGVEVGLREIAGLPEEEKIFPSFGSKILEDALEYFLIESNILEFNLDRFTKDHVTDLSRKLYSWGCVTNSLRNL